MSNKAVKILAEAMYDVVDKQDDRSKHLGETMQDEFSEFDLQPHFDDMSLVEKFACSDRAEDLAYAERGDEASISESFSESISEDHPAVKALKTDVTWDG